MGPLTAEEWGKHWKFFLQKSKIIKSVGAIQGDLSELAYIFNQFDDSEAQWSFKVELKFFPGHLDMALETWGITFEIW